MEFQGGANDKYYLALLGDIGNPFQENYYCFFKKFHQCIKKYFMFWEITNIIITTLIHINPKFYLIKN